MIAPHIVKWALERDKQPSELRVDAGNATDIPNHTPKKRKKYERVLETKGGGGYVPPPQPSPMEQAQARDWEAAQEAARQEHADQIRQQQADAAKAAADAAWQSGRGTAYNAALSSGMNRLRGMGIDSGDPYGVYNEFTGRLNQANAGLTTGADYSSAFAPTILDEILGSARTGQRNKYRSSFNTALDPYYAEDTFGSTADDAILASILNSQYGDALSDLDSARARGQATQSVYDRAVRDLGTAKTTANSTLQGIGGGVLSGIVGDINTRRQGALDRAAEWDFGTTYDPTQEANRIRNYAGERQAGLEGAVRGAVGDQQLFDINSILGNARARAGTTAPTTTGTGALSDTFQNEAQRDASTRANEGIF